MSNEMVKKKLHWACRRGMLELDVVLIAFLEKKFDELTGTQKNSFEELLSCTDPELLSWLIHRFPSPPEFQEIVYLIKKVSLNEY